MSGDASTRGLFNTQMAREFRTAASLLRAQGADSRRIAAFERGADTLDRSSESVASVYRRDGIAGLVAIPTIGRGLASAIADVVEFGHWRWLERLRGDADPERVLASIPTVGPVLAHRLHRELHVDSLDELERAVYDGRLGRMRDVGDKRWHAIRDELLARRRIREAADAAESPESPEPDAAGTLPSSELLLSIDAEYRRRAGLGELPTVTPGRFNPNRVSWLPVLHTERSGRHYTAMFSNTSRAHELGRTNDWVVISVDESDDHWTVVTEWSGPMTGRRIVRGVTASSTSGPAG